MKKERTEEQRKKKEKWRKKTDQVTEMGPTNSVKNIE